MWLKNDSSYYVVVGVSPVSQLKKKQLVKLEETNFPTMC